MRGLKGSERVYLFRERIDFRYGIYRLISLASTVVCRPQDGVIFVFFGRRSDRVKLLYFDEDGCVLLYKLLEKGTFKVSRGIGVDQITGVALEKLLRGIDYERIKFQEKMQLAS